MFRLIIICTSFLLCSVFVHLFKRYVLWPRVFSVTVQLEVIYKRKGLEEPFGTQRETKRLLSIPAGPLHRVAYYGNNVAPTITT